VRHRVTIHGAFPLEGGGTLHDVEVEARTWGRHGSNATLVCHALTGNADADEWWAGLFDAGRLLDPSERFVVSMNVLGGCAGTTGPTSTDPSSGLPYGPDFPAVTVRDTVRLHKRVLDELGVTKLDVVVGGSMGGMQVLEWAVMYPDLVEAIVPVAVGSSQSAWALGLSDAQRAAIEADAAFMGGRYEHHRSPASGLAVARMIAMCSYRSPQSFEARFGRGRDDEGVFSIASYLRYQGDKLVARFDANTYLTLLATMDSHDLGRGRGPVEAILRRITARTLVVGISTDVLYPVSEVRELATSIPRARFAVLDSPHGHDGFLIDTDQLDRLVRDFLTETRRPSEVSGHGRSWA
jgi:homoserine O-acetyltransferase/O-succinyltransferase